ncbi:MAG: hypothetical protein ACXAAH_06470 [Promethearchaeota archaeon]|jgi:hypothetical protein
MTLASPLETVIGRNGSIIRRYVGGGGTHHKVRANGADLFNSALATRTGETADDPDVDLCAKGERINGIIVGEWDKTVNLDKDSDDPYADNTWLDMYTPLPGEEVYITIKTNTAITVYTDVQADGGFGIPWAYGDGTEATDTRVSIAGQSQNTIAAVASTETACLIEWSGGA